MCFWEVTQCYIKRMEEVEVKGSEEAGGMTNASSIGSEMLFDHLADELREVVVIAKAMWSYVVAILKMVKLRTRHEVERA